MHDDDYSRVHRHFLAPDLPPLLEDVLPRLRGATSLADVGCGDGAILWALERRVGLPSTVYAVDYSLERVRRAASLFPAVIPVVADAAHLPLETGSIDVIVCSQMIEHVRDDRAVVRELCRVVRPGGWCYVGSVLRSRRAWWIYRGDGGRRLLDPTHVREYPSVREFEDVVSEAGSVEAIRVTPFRFPVLDLALRGLQRAGAVDADSMSRLYEGRLGALRRLARVRPPGYSMVEAIVRRD